MPYLGMKMSLRMLEAGNTGGRFYCFLALPGLLKFLRL